MQNVYAKLKNRNGRLMDALKMGNNNKIKDYNVAQEAIS